MKSGQVDKIADHIAEFSFAYLRQVGSRHSSVAIVRTRAKIQKIKWPQTCATTLAAWIIARSSAIPNSSGVNLDIAATRTSLASSPAFREACDRF
jgi:hypothetical protein